MHRHTSLRLLSALYIASLTLAGCGGNVLQGHSIHAPLPSASLEYVRYAGQASSISIIGVRSRGNRYVIVDVAVVTRLNVLRYEELNSIYNSINAWAMCKCMPFAFSQSGHTIAYDHRCPTEVPTYSIPSVDFAPPHRAQLHTIRQGEIHISVMPIFVMLATPIDIRRPIAIRLNDIRNQFGLTVDRTEHTLYIADL